VGVGAIFRTGSKSEAGEVARDQIGPINSLGLVTVAIGGIGQGNAALVWSMGFDGLAVISALARAADPEGTARAIMAARPA
jgi:thiamine monophosphate synthase